MAELDIDQYLFNEVRPKKERLEEIVKTATESVRFLSHVFDERTCCFRTEYPTRREELPYSYTNEAQCAFTIGRILKNLWWRSIRDNISLSKDIRDMMHKCMSALLQKIRNEEPHWPSSTFGDDNAFTASWIALMLDAGSSGMATDEDALISKFLETPGFERLCTSIADGLCSPHTIAGADGRNRAGAHAFTTDRCITAAKSLLNLIETYKPSNFTDIKNRLKEALDYARSLMLTTFYQQIGYHGSRHFGFDPAELIPSLASLGESKAMMPDQPLVDQALDIIREEQSRNIYWRPYRPFFMKEDGLVLLPLSVDSAHALLRIAKTMECFEKLEPAFQRYFDWIITQKKTPKNCKGMCAWCSENAPGADLPNLPRQTYHVWQTAEMALFAVEYGEQLAGYLQEDILEKSGFSVMPPKRIKVKWPANLEHSKSGDISLFDWGKEPPNRVLKQIEDRFIKPHRPFPGQEAILSPRGSFSMLVYGPPGTSKTTIANALAHALNFPLIVITMSDFLRRGADAIEERAKMIFDLLGEMEKVVVLFDEIDRLILDRDSPMHSKQAEIIQFMPNSMLVKLQNLRQRQNLIYIMATNYREQIDKAVRRPPRIDFEYLILPFDLVSREKMLTALLRGKLELSGVGNKEVDQCCTNSQGAIKQLAKITPLYVYEELKGIVSNAVKVDAAGVPSVVFPTSANKLEVQPKITIDRRTSEFDELERSKPPRLNYDEHPCEEYISLCLLLLEVKALEDKAKDTLRTLWFRLRESPESRQICLRIVANKWASKLLSTKVLDVKG